MSTILVVGARSTLAREVTKRLQGEYTVLTAGRSDCDVTIDLTGPVTIPDDVTVVVNFAAAFGGPSDEAVLETIETNVTGALRLCMAAKQAGVTQFVQVSSMSAVHESTSPYYSEYAITKRQADELLEWYCSQHDMKLAVLRPSQLYGDSSAYAKHQPFFYQIVDAAAQGQDVTIYGTHDARRNYLHAQDFSEVVARVVARSVKGIYPCLYPEDVTYSHIAKTAQDVFAKGGEVVFAEDKPDTPDNVFPMDLALYDLIEFRPAVTLEMGLQSIKAQREGATT